MSVIISHETAQRLVDANGTVPEELTEAITKSVNLVEPLLPADDSEHTRTVVSDQYIRQHPKQVFRYPYSNEPVYYAVEKNDNGGVNIWPLPSNVDEAPAPFLRGLTRDDVIRYVKESEDVIFQEAQQRMNQKVLLDGNVTLHYDEHGFASYATLATAEEKVSLGDDAQEPAAEVAPAPQPAPILEPVTEPVTETVPAPPETDPAPPAAEPTVEPDTNTDGKDGDVPF